MIRIYEVEFNKYRNTLVKDDYIEDEEGNGIDIGNPCLVKEEDIEAIRKYGGGIKTLKLIGELTFN